MARNNRVALSKILSTKSTSGKSPSSCNRPAKCTRKVNSLGPDGSATMKFISTVSKNSECANNKLSSSKLRRGNGKNLLGTVDQVIAERKIFTTVAKMPSEIQTKLINNGWVGKISIDGGYFRQSGKVLVVNLIYL